MGMTPIQTKQVLTVLLGAFPRVELDEPSVLVYAQAIAEFDVDIAMVAIEQWVKRESRFPSVAELRGMCRARVKRVEERLSAPALPAPAEPASEFRARGLAGVALARREIVEGTKRRTEAVMAALGDEVEQNGGDEVGGTDPPPQEATA